MEIITVHEATAWVGGVGMVGARTEVKKITKGVV